MTTETNESESANGSERTNRDGSMREKLDRDGSNRTGSSRRVFLARSAGVASAAGLVHVGLLGGAAADSGGETTTFTVRVQNVSNRTTLETSAKGDAMKQPVPLSPGVYAVHSESGPLFDVGERARGNGLEALAEDGMPMELAGAVAERSDVSDSGAFATPVGGSEPAPIGPDGAYEFSIEAAPGDRLSLATMFVQSNDLFYAPEPRGIGLFCGEEPLTGDATHAIGLWDAGTECNEEPGVGEHQAPRQSEAGAGMAEDAPVRSITDVGDGYSYPYASEVIRVSREVEMR